MEVDGEKKITEDQEEEWAVECSDEENYKIGRDDIIEFYTKIANGEALELEWKCPGRRSPTPEPNTENAEEAEVVNREPMTEQKVVVPGFDFDDGSSSSGLVTPRRASVGSAKQPRIKQKRVAQLDKIMNDMRRHRKMDEESRKSEDGSSPRPTKKGSPKLSS